MQGIYWLASYPKSGNTWFRVFLANLLQERTTPVDINQLGGIPIATSRELLDQTLDISTGDLTIAEVTRLRPHAYAQMAREATEPIFLKIHDAYGYTDRGESLISPTTTLGVIYFIRNPLDVVVSFAHHQACDFNQIVRDLADDQFGFCRQSRQLPPQLQHDLRSWSHHVTSWVDAPGLSVHVVRYEDMLRSPLDTFTQAVQFAQLPHSATQIEQALSLSTFAELQRQEQAQGFYEKMPRAQSFFRAGQMGHWRQMLTSSQITQVIADHGAVMERFGYLPFATQCLECDA